jgi:hypothetical protein
VDQRLSNQKSRQLDRIHGQFRAAQAADVKWSLHIGPVQLLLDFVVPRAQFRFSPEGRALVVRAGEPSARPGRIFLEVGFTVCGKSAYGCHSERSEESLWV